MDYVAMVYNCRKLYMNLYCIYKRLHNRQPGVTPPWQACQRKRNSVLLSFGNKKRGVAKLVERVSGYIGDGMWPNFCLEIFRPGILACSALILILKDGMKSVEM